MDKNIAKEEQHLSMVSIKTFTNMTDVAFDQVVKFIGPRDIEAFRLVQKRCYETSQSHFVRDTRFVVPFTPRKNFEPFCDPRDILNMRNPPTKLWISFRDITSFNFTDELLPRLLASETLALDFSGFNNAQDMNELRQLQSVLGSTTLMCKELRLYYCREREPLQSIRWNLPTLNKLCIMDRVGSGEPVSPFGVDSTYRNLLRHAVTLQHLFITIDMNTNIWASNAATLALETTAWAVRTTHDDVMEAIVSSELTGLKTLSVKYLTNGGSNLSSRATECEHLERLLGLKSNALCIGRFKLTNIVLFDFHAQDVMEFISSQKNTLKILEVDYSGRGSLTAWSHWPAFPELTSMTIPFRFGAADITVRELVLKCPSLRKLKFTNLRRECTMGCRFSENINCNTTLSKITSLALSFEYNYKTSGYCVGEPHAVRLLELEAFLNVTELFLYDVCTEMITSIFQSRVAQKLKRMEIWPSKCQAIDNILTGYDANSIGICWEAMEPRLEEIARNFTVTSWENICRVNKAAKKWQPPSGPTLRELTGLQMLKIGATNVHAFTILFILKELEHVTALSIYSTNVAKCVLRKIKDTHLSPAYYLNIEH